MRPLVSLIVALAATSLPAATELRLLYTRESLTGTHRHYRQYVDGVPLIGADVVESRGVRTPARDLQSATVGVPRAADLYALEVNGTIRLVRRSIERIRPLEPYAHYTDALTGELLRVEPLFYQVAARVFDPNPVARLNDPSLRDDNNSATAVPESAYTLVDLLDVEAGGFLRGPNAMIVDNDPPAIAPVIVSGPLLFNRGQSAFEDVNAYYQVDRAQRYLQSLGFFGPRRIAPYSIPIDTHAAGGTDSSFFLPSGEVGRGQLYFGDGGVDDAEDGDLVTHEYGHAMLEWIAPGAFGGTNASEGRALSEGFCDWWAFSLSYAGAVASGRDPACFADWDPRCTGEDSSQACGYPVAVDCLRRVDSTKTFADYINNDASGVEHRNGEIWSATLRDIFLQFVGRYGFEEGKRLADTVIVEALFGTPANPTFRTLAGQIITADRLLNGGANEPAICEAMTLRAILQPGECNRMPRGERTLFQSDQQGIAIPDNSSSGMTSTLVIEDDRLIEKLSVQVNITHEARGDLRITLVAPDGTQVLLQRETFDQTANLVGTYGLDVQPNQSLDLFRGRSPRGMWQLRIADVRQRDRGSLVSWGLVIQFAGDAPLADRPHLANRWHIAAVASTRGVSGTKFVTDVRVFNGGTRPVAAMLVFTPSGQDGRTEFAAARVAVAPQQVVALNDIVNTLFQTAGTGQLEIDADTPDLIATSRTFTRDDDGGTFGQFVPTSSASDATLFVPQLEVSADFRSNVGFAEVNGASGAVRLTVLDATTGRELSSKDFAMTPYGHVQAPIGIAGQLLVRLTVTDGQARIVGYGSVVDNRSGDAIYVPAQRPPERTVFAPAISARGALGTNWRSDVVLTNVSGQPVSAEIRYVNAMTGAEKIANIELPAIGSRRLDDVVSSTFGSPDSIGVVSSTGAIATSRVWTPSSTGTVGQFVSFADKAETPAELLHIETSVAFRTNVGLIGTEDSEAVVQLFDAGGKLLETRNVAVAAGRLLQFPINVPVVNGRVTVTTPRGSVIPYASVIDNRSGDAIFVGPASLQR